MSEGYSPLLAELIKTFQCLPGVGAKSAQRMAFYLLDKDRDGALRLAQSLKEASRLVVHCERCRMLTEERYCGFCTSNRRDDKKLCVVETPADVLAIEQSGAYLGRYFVLMGHLSPIDGIGPKELGLDLLEQRLKEEDISEVILATSVTVEGDATAHIVAIIAQRSGSNATRIAYGIPVGGELEFIDGGTLSRALSGRRDMTDALPKKDLP
jgi:recombination protein RecR